MVESNVDVKPATYQNLHPHHRRERTELQEPEVLSPHVVGIDLLYWTSQLQHRLAKLLTLKEDSSGLK
jgi:hypothetical protein